MSISASDLRILRKTERSNKEGETIEVDVLQYHAGEDEWGDLWVDVPVVEDAVDYSYL